MVQKKLSIVRGVNILKSSKSSNTVRKVNAFVNPLIKTVMTISMLTVIGFGVLKLNNHELSAGEFVSFTLYLFGLVNPVVQFSNFFTGVQQAKVRFIG